MSNWKRLNFGLALFFMLFAFAVVILQTFDVFFNGSVPPSRLSLSALLTSVIFIILLVIVILWRRTHPILLWLPALSALILFVSVLVGVCPACKWSIKNVEMGEGDLAATYQTTAFHGISQFAAVGEDGLWIADMANSRIILLDPQTRGVIQAITVGRSPIGIALGPDSIWTADYSDGTVTRVDLQSRIPTAVVDVGGKPLLLAVADDAVWVTDQERGVVSRISPLSNKVEATVRLGFGPVGIVASPQGIWVALSQETQIVLIDPVTSKVVRRLDSAYGTLNMAIREDDLWAVSPVTGYVQRFNIAAREKVADIQVGGEPTGVAVDDQYAWVARSAENDVVRISVIDNTLVGDPLPTGDLPKTLFSDGRGGIWIVEEGEQTVSHLTPSGPEEAAAEEPADNWITSWLSVTARTVTIMAFTGSPIFLLVGIIMLTLALAIWFLLESRYIGRVPLFWLPLFFFLLAFPMLFGFFDLWVALSATASIMIAFILVLFLTDWQKPEGESESSGEKAGVALA